MWISMDALSNNSPPVFELFHDQDKVVDTDQVLKEKSKSNGKLELKIKKNSPSDRTKFTIHAKPIAGRSRDTSQEPEGWRTHEFTKPFS